jgi:nicotinamidase-related amidase
MKPDNTMTQEVELSNLISPAHAGLLVVDVQGKLFSHIADNEAVAARICQAIRAAGQLGIPVLSCEQYVRGLGPTIKEVQAALSEILAPSPIEKTAFSCFGEPLFVDAFEKSGIDTLAIVGIEAHVCVLQTALQALDRGIDVVLIAEAVGSRKAAHKDEAIMRLRDAGCIVGSVEMFVFEMMRTAQHAAFRAAQRIIL